MSERFVWMAKPDMVQMLGCLGCCCPAVCSLYAWAHGRSLFVRPAMCVVDCSVECDMLRTLPMGSEHVLLTCSLAAWVPKGTACMLDGGLSPK